MTRVVPLIVVAVVTTTLCIGNGASATVPPTGAAFLSPWTKRLHGSSSMDIGRNKKIQLASATDGNPPPFGDYSNWSNSNVAAASGGEATSSFSTAASPVALGNSPALSTSAPNSSSSSSSEDEDPIAIFAASQAESMRQLQEAIPDLTLKPNLCLQATEDYSPTLNAYDAPGSSNVAWLADVSVPKILTSLTIFNGPLTSVPHLLSRCSVIGDGQQQQPQLHLTVDVRPRAYGAYELYDPATKEYPGPETLGRKAFEFSAARNEYNSLYVEPSRIADLLLNPNNQFEGSIVVQQPSELDRLTGGPYALSVTMPATASNVNAIVAIRQTLVTAYISWVGLEAARHRPGAPVNTQYVYDSKFRQNAYLALLPAYTQIFATSRVDGKALAVAESGPLDEGYVGGGS